MRILFLLLFFINIVFANVAIVSAFKGNAIVARDGSFLKVNTGFELEKHDNIKTGDKTKLQLIFKDNTIITIGKNSNFSIDEYIYDETNTTNVEARFTYAKGLFGTITGKIGKINPNKFKINAKSATLGIRGTQFDVFISNYILKVSVSQGSVYVLINKEMKDILPSEVFIYEFKTGKSLLKDGNVEESKEFYEWHYKFGLDGLDRDKEDLKDDEDKDYPQDDKGKDRGKDKDNPRASQDINNPQIIAGYQGYRTSNSYRNNNLRDEDPNDGYIVDDNMEVQLSIFNMSADESIEETTDYMERQIPVILPLAKEIMDIDNDDIVGLKYGYWVNPNEDYVRFATFIDGETNATSATAIADYIDGTTGDGSLQATYNGGVASIVTNSSGEQTSTEGTIDLNIDFRNQDLTGNINLDNNWHAYINSGDVTTAGFSSTDLINGNNTNDTISSGSLNGNYYGDDAQSVGGTFTLNSTSNGNIEGVFGANSINKIYTPEIQPFYKEIVDNIPHLDYGYWRDPNQNDLIFDTFFEFDSAKIINHNSSNASYVGDILAMVTNSNNDTTNINGTININLDFTNNANSLVQMDFNEYLNDNSYWDVQTNSLGVEDSYFYSRDISAVSSGQVQDGGLSGNYYGDAENGVQSVGGFLFLNSNNGETLNGTFGASKQ